MPEKEEYLCVWAVHVRISRSGSATLGENNMRYLHCGAIFAFAILVTSLSAQEPPYCAKELLRAARAGAYSYEEAREECWERFKEAKFVSLKIENAAALLWLMRGAPTDLVERSRMRNDIEDCADALRAVVPLYRSLDEKRTESLAALRLGQEISLTVSRILQWESDPYRYQAYWRLPIACLQAILDADIDGCLIPPDTFLAENQIPSLEREWAKKELKWMKAQAETTIVDACMVHDRKSGFMFSVQNVQRVMEENPGNEIIQKAGEQKQRNLQDMVRSEALDSVLLSLSKLHPRKNADGE